MGGVAILLTNGFDHVMPTLAKPFYWILEIWFTMGLHCHSIILNMASIICIDESLGTRFAINTLC
jgi:hypothetical protein